MTAPASESGAGRGVRHPGPAVTEWTRRRTRRTQASIASELTRTVTVAAAEDHDLQIMEFYGFE